MRKGFIEDMLLLLITGLVAIYFLIDMVDPLHTVDRVGFKPYVVTSPSMEPTINTYDMVIVIHVDAEDIEVGDIISFRAYLPDLGGIGIVTHYVAAIDDSGYIINFETQGEGRPVGAYDDWRNEQGQPVNITEADVLGEVAFVIPKVGYAIAALRDPVFLLLVIANISILILFIHFLRKPRQAKNG